MLPQDRVLRSLYSEKEGFSEIMFGKYFKNQVKRYIFYSNNMSKLSKKKGAGT